MSSRIQQLLAAGMHFSTDPPPSDAQDAIDSLTDTQFEKLLELSVTLDKAPLFLAFADGLQTRAGEP